MIHTPRDSQVTQMRDHLLERPESTRRRLNDSTDYKIKILKQGSYFSLNQQEEQSSRGVSPMNMVKRLPLSPNKEFDSTVKKQTSFNTRGDDISDFRATQTKVRKFNPLRFQSLRSIQTNMR